MIKDILSFGFVLLVFLSMPVHAGGELSKAATNHAYGKIDVVVEAWALQNIPNIRLLELETKVRKNNHKPDFRLITILELSGDEYRKHLSQISFSTFDNRETLNLGWVMRKMNSDKTIIHGLNAFLDIELRSAHQRLGLGYELKSSAYDLNINTYWGITGKHTFDGAIEDTADGYDVEVGVYLPYLPWAKLYYKGYRWDSSIFDIEHGEQWSLHMQPTPRLTIEWGRQDDNTKTGTFFLQANYVLCCEEYQHRPFMFMSPTAYSYKNVENRFFERVRRENKIVKGVKGAVSVGRGT